MYLRILGPVEVLDDGVGVTLDGAKHRTVLAALLTAEHGFVSDAELSAYLWGANPPATLNAQIYNYVSRLRKALGPAVSITRCAPGYLTRLNGARFDLAEFEHLSVSGAAALGEGRAQDARTLLQLALALWRGPALANVSEHLSSAEGPRLEEARISALEHLIDAELALDRHGHVLPQLTRLVARHPLRERFRAQLMTTLYRSGRQAEALSHYERGRRILSEELGVEPGLLLREVHHAILTADPALLAGV
ncbi:AfsR/SARP family transcriptional regulator [Lentzea flaviverrucosa]|uniref:DNA-binding transcriptional activator of the SARP family n=1 Tax=Lentzea flaviverrucosa TaxID=200379 RepID=A0A1H9SG64_9PSEU|nr:AfsR/SARP family transcriptional regulator [Lentzea flaviverrucosa]RDI25347.1 DNA-binding SARP family transcriptional activator [Lentzea flaviverrucosa]SER83595.1 DNA-binding transcriptional activator of the SARP family [Lentzea flaviverrucosa]